MKNMICAVMVLLPMTLAGSVATANDELTLQGMLATAKIAGACGIMDSMIDLQRTTKLAGGDEFVTRFWSVEAARLGLTVEQLSDRCTKAIAGYDKMWALAEE